MDASTRLAHIRPTPAAVLAREARRLAGEGVDVVNFASGDVDYPGPDAAIQAACKAVQGATVGYTNVDGDPAMKAAIAQDFQSRHGLVLRPDQIIVSTGSKQSLFGALFVSTSPNDEVLIPAPYWSSYIDISRLAGCTPVTLCCDEESSFKLTPHALEAAITPRTRWLILTSPGSPVGAVYTGDELRALGRVLSEHPRVCVLFDELYESFVFQSSKHVNFAAAVPELATRILTVGGVSKSYAMMGWRIGWAVGDATLISSMTTLQSQVTSSASTVGQAAALAALRQGGEHRASLTRSISVMRNYALSALSKVPGVRVASAAGSIYLFVDISAVAHDDRSFSEQLLRQTGVVVLPGSDCGASGYVRINIARTQRDLESGLERLRTFIAAAQ